MLYEIFNNLRLADFLDIAVVAILLNIALGWLLRRSSRSAAVLLLVLLGVYVISHALNMYLTLSLFRTFFTVIVFSLVVIFQRDLRYALERLAFSKGWLQRSSVRPQEKFIQALAGALVELAEKRIGALVVIPGLMPLDSHMEGGVAVDAEFSTTLLQSIFNTKAPGHDGAVILREKRIERIAVHLPLSKNLQQLKVGGTRHAAALGLAEGTDALVIVVSEERGAISLAQNGAIRVLPSAPHLVEALAEIEHPYLAQAPKNARSSFTRPLGIGLTSVLLSCLLWLLFAYRVETVYRTINDVPIEFRNVAEGWVIEDASPSSTRLTLTGPERAFQSLDERKLRVTIDLRNLHPGENTASIVANDVELPPDLKVSRIDNEVVRLRASLAEPAKPETGTP